MPTKVPGVTYNVTPAVLMSHVHDPHVDKIAAETGCAENATEEHYVTPVEWTT